MKKNGKRRGVSRRDFLKGLGGGVGAAVISTGLLKPGRAEAFAQPSARSAPVSVKAGVTDGSKEVSGLNEVLSKEVLEDLKSYAGLDEILVTCRLNLTGRKDPAPIWYGWVESSALQKRSRRAGAPSKLIGTDNLSPIYSRVLTHRPRDYVHEVDLSRKDIEDAEKTRNAKREDVKLKIFHRMYVAVVVDKTRAGSLTVGFPKPTDDDIEVKHRLRYWAQDRNSKLVQYLKNTFGANLSGPRA